MTIRSEDWEQMGAVEIGCRVVDGGVVWCAANADVEAECRISRSVVSVEDAEWLLADQSTGYPGPGWPGISSWCHHRSHWRCADAPKLFLEGCPTLEGDTVGALRRNLANSFTVVSQQEGNPYCDAAVFSKQHSKAVVPNFMS